MEKNNPALIAVNNIWCIPSWEAHTQKLILFIHTASASWLGRSSVDESLHLIASSLFCSVFCASVKTQKVVSHSLRSVKPVIFNSIRKHNHSRCGTPRYTFPLSKHSEIFLLQVQVLALWWKPAHFQCCHCLP